MTIKVGIIGAGRIGTDHAERLLLTGQARPAAVFDVDQASATRLASDTGAEVVPSLTELIKHPGVDAVIVASPGDTHAEAVLGCIAASKPVLCEKPMTRAVEDAERIIASEQAAGRRLVQVGFMRRYDEQFRTLRAAGTAEAIGDVLMAHCVHRNVSVSAPFTSQDALTDGAVHEFDTIRWLLQEEIASVQVIGGASTPQASPGLIDPMLIVCTMTSGVIVTCEAYYNAQFGYDVRCELVGTRGIAATSLEGPVSVYTGGRAQREIPGDWRIRFADAYLAEIRHWLSSLAKAGSQNGPSAWDGYMSALAAAAGVASLESGGAEAIKVPERPAFYA